MNQRGVTESTQWALLMPLLLSLILALVQLGVWLHSRNVAAQAAAVVADVRAAHIRAGDQAEAAGRRLAIAGGLQDVRIDVTDTDHWVEVTVTGRAPVFFDIGQGQITERAVLAAEDTP